MKQADKWTITYGLTAKPDSQRKEVLFFATAHFRFFNFLANTQMAHLLFPQPHKPNAEAKAKEPFSHRLNSLLCNKI